MKRNMYLFALLFTLAACTEESLTKKTQGESFTAQDIQSFAVSTCSNFHFEKPPVDILFVVDNSGSTNMDSFKSLKNEIAGTLDMISSEFDYHIYVAPLMPVSGDSITSYPLIVSNASGLPNTATHYNIQSVDSLNFFQSYSGNNLESGFQRAVDLVNGNTANGIFRQNAHLVIINISNGDDTSVYRTIGGNRVFDASVYNDRKTKLKNLLGGTHQAESLRYLTLVAHSACKGFGVGKYYKQMANELYGELGFSSDSEHRHSYNLCSGNYTDLFKSVNKSIRQVLVGHSYDHWKISSASASSIQESEIKVTKVLKNGDRVDIVQNETNGFEYLGAQTNINTRYAPTAGEPVTGLVIKLNGNARVSYPDCIIAKTETPTEYFGFIALPRKPDLDTIEVTIRNRSIPKSSSNGWTYMGYSERQNLKVPGETNAPVTPELNRSGYFLRLHGSAIFTNGDTVKVNYKPESI